jgi:hypothetical protein
MLCIMTNNKCIYYSESKCRILTIKKCDECKFFKTEKQAAAERRASFDRRVRLGGPFSESDREYLKTVQN